MAPRARRRVAGGADRPLHPWPWPAEPLTGAHSGHAEPDASCRPRGRPAALTLEQSGMGAGCSCPVPTYALVREPADSTLWCRRRCQWRRPTTGPGCLAAGRAGGGLGGHRPAGVHDDPSTVLAAGGGPRRLAHRRTRGRRRTGSPLPFESEALRVLIRPAGLLRGRQLLRSRAAQGEDARRSGDRQLCPSDSHRLQAVRTARGQYP